MDTGLTQGDYNEAEQEIYEPVFELGYAVNEHLQNTSLETYLIRPLCRDNNGGSQSSGDANRQTPDHAAHGDVPEHALLAISRCEVENDGERGDNQNRAPGEEAR